MSSFYGQIYKITYPNDPHYYYGQTKQGIEVRLRNHLKDAEDGCPYDLHKWIRRINPDYLIIREVDNAISKEELKSQEIKYIGDLWETDPYCLNMTPGGQGGSDNNQVSGEDHPRAKLNWEIVHYIRDNIYTKDHSLLASEFDITTFHLSAIIYNEMWYDPDYTPPPKDGRFKPSGEKHPNAVLSWYTVFWVRINCHRVINTYGRVITQKNLAEALNNEQGIKVDQPRIYYILSNRAWKDPNWDPVNRVYTGEPKGWKEDWGDWTTSFE